MSLRAISMLVGIYGKHNRLCRFGRKKSGSNIERLRRQRLLQHEMIRLSQLSKTTAFSRNHHVPSTQTLIKKR